MIVGLRAAGAARAWYGRANVEDSGTGRGGEDPPVPPVERKPRQPMAKLEELTRGASLRGILPDALVTVVDVKWFGSAAVELTYKDAAGRLGNELLYRDREPALDIAIAGRPWSFDGDGALRQLVYREPARDLPPGQTLPQ